MNRKPVTARRATRDIPPVELDEIDRAIDETEVITTPDDPPPVPEPTVSEKLQEIIDGPSDQGNAIVIPHGEYELDKQLVITKWRQKIRRENKWGTRKAVFTGPYADDPFLFD